MKRKIAILAVALVGLAACANKQPAPGSYVWRGDDGTRLLEIHIIHGDCTAYDAYTEDGQQVASIGPFEKKGRWPRYTYTCRQGGSDLTITARFDGNGQLEADIAGRTVWGSHTTDIETTKPLTFTLEAANFQQTD